MRRDGTISATHSAHEKVPTTSHRALARGSAARGHIRNASHKPASIKLICFYDGRCNGC